ncbi:MAG: HPr family phosphocarrier protein [Spirochaetales bacterium]|uniref:HPr family phosphocarrier protein n=1 Tax=Candidatus Thalassospirochaeta sargassi TaxID=3119039 RepID=A0AAJ1IJF0_9SPIO|nr:HPr family phosphocarrier protein [Spirochaetales bacterium]
MKELDIVVKNDTGLHSRPADVFVRTAKLFESDIKVSKGEKSANAKTIIKVILLNVSQNDTIKITADGPDEDAAIEELKMLIESDFEKINDSVKI